MLTQGKMSTSIKILKCTGGLDNIIKCNKQSEKRNRKENSMEYDVIIVGAGPSGIFCAYELINKDPSLNILMLEKGNDMAHRICPKRKTGVCVHCKPCNITTGFAGAGAFSDGKLTLASSETGGNLDKAIGFVAPILAIAISFFLVQ